MIAAWPVSKAVADDPADPIINLFLQKGFITETEAAKAKAEIEAIRTNQVQEIPHIPESKWKISEGIKTIQLFGDLRLRYEDRRAEDPTGGRIDLQRFRYAVRIGIRGEVFDNFSYGVRVDTAPTRVLRGFPSVRHRAALLIKGHSENRPPA